eukprot:TRINITY_DN1927_c0_g1_i4.p1 TRINITY_DN1927_c0_g1~~TRINITY_DN1927_c0_g1_i4.p1  ORF type:complete len:374 (-),score=76.94 TRINITY_DN1927_c0_g1_i4:18-1139(-)
MSRGRGKAKAVDSDGEGSDAEAAARPATLSPPSTVTYPMECRWGSCRGLIFDSAEQMGQHVNEHVADQRNRKTFSGARYFCEWDGCSRALKPFTSTGNVVIHLRYLHTGERPFACSGCDAKFVQNCDMKQHARNVHAIKPYVAPRLDGDMAKARPKKENVARPGRMIVPRVNDPSLDYYPPPMGHSLPSLPHIMQHPYGSSSSSSSSSSLSSYPIPHTPYRPPYQPEVDLPPTISIRNDYDLYLKEMDFAYDKGHTTFAHLLQMARSAWHNHPHFILVWNSQGRKFTPMSSSKVEAYATRDSFMEVVRVSAVAETVPDPFSPSVKNDPFPPMPVRRPNLDAPTHVFYPPSMNMPTTHSQKIPQPFLHPSPFTI